MVCQVAGSDLGLATAGGTNQHYDIRILRGLGMGNGRMAFRNDFHQFQKLIIVVHCQHTGGLLIPGAAHQNGMLGAGVQNVVQGIIEEDIRMDIVLAGTHINMIRRNLRKFFHDPLGPYTHKLGWYGSADKHFRHLAQLSDKFLCALIDGLVAIEIRIAEIGIDHIRPGAQLAPFFLLINADWGIKSILFIGQGYGIGCTFHQKIVNIQSNR